ncbi:hypothetical protein HanIR_Chr13g0625961 [Helianthus annuus]|nr:hypothetical protein HanIR_Chr13g0625961 [Helianthus annuus]
MSKLFKHVVVKFPAQVTLEGFYGAVELGKDKTVKFNKGGESLRFVFQRVDPHEV